MKEWFEQLSQRERWVLIGGAVFVALLLLYLLVLEPVARARDSTATRLGASQRLFSSLQHIAAEASVARAAGTRAPSAAGGSLLSVVDRSSREAGIRQQVTRLTPEGQDRVRLWFEQVSFDRMIGWLAGLQQQDGVQVEQLSAAPQGNAGYARVSVTLVR